MASLWQRWRKLNSQQSSFGLLLVSFLFLVPNDTLYGFTDGGCEFSITHMHVSICTHNTRCLVAFRSETKRRAASNDVESLMSNMIWISTDNNSDHTVWGLIDFKARNTQNRILFWTILRRSFDGWRLFR